MKCGEIIIFDHKFYLKTINIPSNFVPAVEILSKDFCHGGGVFEQKFSGPRVRGGGLPVKMLPALYPSLSKKLGFHDNLKPGLHIVVTIAEHACDHVLKKVLKLLIYRLQIFLVKYEYLRS